jgi:hypothetical protein
LLLVFDTVIIPSLAARSHWFSLTAVGFKHFEWASRSELNPKPYIGFNTNSLAVLCRKLPISRLIHRRSFSTSNGIIMRRFGKTLGEGARRFYRFGHTYSGHSMDSFFWSAVLDLRSEEMRKALSNTSSEDRFWGLTRVYMLVQRVYWKSVSATLDLHLDLDGCGKHHEHFGVCNLGCLSVDGMLQKELGHASPNRPCRVPVPFSMLVRYLSESHSPA